MACADDIATAIAIAADKIFMPVASGAEARGRANGVAEGDQGEAAPERESCRRLFGRCDVLHRWSFGFDFLAVFIGLVQKPIDHADAAFLPRIFGLLPVVKDFVIPSVTWAASALTEGQPLP